MPKRRTSSKPTPRAVAVRSPSPRLRKLAANIRKFALSFPGVTEDYPWGERVVKVNNKVFAFLGDPYLLNGNLNCTVKLTRSRAAALKLRGAKPCGYGLGKHGWVTIRVEPGKSVPTLSQYKKWITESFEAVTTRSK